ncbi:MAG: virulence RhuM family protein [Prevotella sp.]|nr:virulence RhuM family protein [Prevotella sp.]
MRPQTNEQTVELFQTDRTSIVRHINNIYKIDELDRNSTYAKIAQVQTEGIRTHKRTQKNYDLDVIISVVYRVKSKRGTAFRIWARKVLKDQYICRIRGRCFAAHEKIIRRTGCFVTKNLYFCTSSDTL